MKNGLTYLAIAATLLMTSCAEKIDISDVIMVDEVGFWHGVWHGMILSISFIVSLFNDDVAVYAIYNNGGWYNFGFVLGIGLFSSVSGVTNKIKK